MTAVGFNEGGEMFKLKDYGAIELTWVLGGGSGLVF